MIKDIHKMDILEVVKIVWDTFAELARSDKASDSKDYFSLEGFAYVQVHPCSRHSSR